MVLVHLKAMRGGTGRRRVLAITSELPGRRGVAEFLARAFALTAAEIEVCGCSSPAEPWRGSPRPPAAAPGTVRTQLHAILQKTGTAARPRLVRLRDPAAAVGPADAEPKRPAAAAEPHQRFLRMPDGRRIEVLSFGDPAGRPVIWMQSTYGFWRLPRAAEADFARRGLRVLVPFRAGWCGSDPLPKGRNPSSSPSPTCAR